MDTTFVLHSHFSSIVDLPSIICQSASATGYIQQMHARQNVRLNWGGRMDIPTHGLTRLYMYCCTCVDATPKGCKNDGRSFHLVGAMATNVDFGSGCGSVGSGTKAQPLPPAYMQRSLHGVKTI